MFDNFLTANGVWQGAVLSLVFFCVYNDNLLVTLLNAVIVCYIGTQFIAALACADDTVLTAPTATA